MMISQKSKKGFWFDSLGANFHKFSGPCDTYDENDYQILSKPHRLYGDSWENNFEVNGKLLYGFKKGSIDDL